MSLVIDLYQAIADAREDRPMYKWHASALAQCPRTQYFKRMGVKPLTRPTGAKVVRWDSGHAIEGTIRPYLKMLYPNLVSNVRFANKSLDLTGEADNYDPDSKTIIEIKSISGHALAYKGVNDDRHYLKQENLNFVPGSREAPKWVKKLDPYLHHEYQQHAYALLMQDPKTEVKWPKEKQEDEVYETLGKALPVEQIIYLYITLDGLMLSYETDVKPEITGAVKKRLDMLKTAWETKTPPPCFCLQENHPLYGNTMKWCEYRTDNGCCSLDLIKEAK